MARKRGTPTHTQSKHTHRQRKKHKIYRFFFFSQHRAHDAIQNKNKTKLEDTSCAYKYI